MIRRTSLSKQLFVGLVLFSSTQRAADWPTFAHDPQRSGWAVEESTLTPANASSLELKWKVQVDNEPKSLTALTAPLVVEGVTTPQGIKTLVYVAGSDNKSFALDAVNGDIVWTQTFKSHVLPKDAGMWLCPNGVNATPTIDRTRSLIFAIAVDGKLWGLDLGTGIVKFGPIQFVSAFSKNWSLNLADGVIYTSISQGCGGAQSGIYSIDTKDPVHPVVNNLFVSSGGGAGIWGRGGPVIGENGRIYVMTGDGAFDPPAGKYGSSFVAASLQTLKLLDYYTPLNYQHINKYDLDMGSGSPVWFAYKGYNLVAGGGKEGVFYLLDADSLGDKDHQTPLLVTPRLGNDEDTFEGKGVWGAPSTWRDEENHAWVYVPVWGSVSKNAPKFPLTNGPNPHGSIMAFKVSVDSTTRKLALEPAWISGDFDLPEPAVIANGVVFAVSTGENPLQTREPNEIVFKHSKLLTDAQRFANTKHAVLYALDAKTGKTLYESGDTMTEWVHFSGLAVTDGHIYAVDHDSRVYCFGLKEQK